MKTGSIIVLAAILAAVGMGCSSMTVTTDYNPAADFAAYETYDWLERETPEGVASLQDKRIMAAIDTEMMLVGFKRVIEGEPDFYVAYHTSIKNRTNVTPYEYGTWHGYPMGSYTEVDRYSEGSLLIDFVDRENKELFWRGWATDAFRDQREAKDKLNEAIRKIIEKYPVQSAAPPK